MYILKINKNNTLLVLAWNFYEDIKKNKDVTNLNDKCWERLKSMAFETYVPESETSKSGAGY